MIELFSIFYLRTIHSDRIHKNMHMIANFEHEAHNFIWNQTAVANPVRHIFDAAGDDCRSIAAL